MVYTADQVASAFIAEGQRRNIKPRGIVICIATGLVESNLTVYANAKVPESMALPHDKVGSDGRSVGPLQQQVVMGAGGWWWGDAATCMDPTKSAGLFYDRLAKLDYTNTNLSPGSFAQAIQQSAFPDRYDQRMGEAQTIYNRLSGGAVVPDQPPLVDPNRPDFNEYWRECSNSDTRNINGVDLWLLHTQEANGNADDLASFLISTEGRPMEQGGPVSYHYTISWNRNDNGVTVCDVVDTDLESYSVGNSNYRSINLCFAGSRAAWSRQQWLDNVGRSIDVAAYLCAQDCVKYGITPKVIPPPYSSDPPGISDHRYCTMHLRDGNNHTDVGDGFPWDVFAAAVAKYWALAHQGVPETPPVEPPVQPPIQPPVVNRPAVTKPETMKGQTGEIWDQLLLRWDMLGGRTIVEALAEIGQKLDLPGFNPPK